MIALQWQAQVLSLLDQSKYPAEEVWVDCNSVEDVAKALSDGTVLTPMDIVGQWFKVTYQGQIGYIKTDFVKLSGTLNGKIQLSDPASKVNLRGTASADGTIVTELADGTLLDVTSVTSDWIQVKVKDGGQTGYVKSDFVKLIY